MEIHQLQYVLALEKFMSFTLAANEICVSQSTLSHQIKKLEEELGVSLFVRTTRSLTLSPAGKEFIEYAKSIVLGIQRAQNAMLEHTNLDKGNIKIGAIRTIAFSGITSVIAAFQKTYPGISIELYEANSDNLIKKLNSEIDVAFITATNGSNYNFDFSPLFEDRLVILVSRSHFLADRKMIDLSEVSQEKFIVMETSSGFRKTLLDICGQAGFNPNIILESSQIETIRGLVEEGIGIAFFSHRIASSISSSKTSIVEFPTTVHRITGLATSKNNNQLLITAFKNFVLQQTF
jgi:LysR family transcriptional activator of glutamate synthase operon